jgi:hypothetical protein
VAWTVIAAWPPINDPLHVHFTAARQYLSQRADADGNGYALRDADASSGRQSARHRDRAAAFHPERPGLAMLLLLVGFVAAAIVLLIRPPIDRRARVRRR